MERRFNILTIGDVHGRSTWKEIIFGGETEYFWWKQSIEEGYDEEKTYEFQKFDKIIFLGDYVDSFDKSNVEILENLKDIIQFAKAYSNLVVLLLGNHDIQYIVKDKICSGYRGEMYHDLYLLFNDNKNLFRIAFLDEFPNHWQGTDYVVKTLWTHAGVTGGWLNEIKILLEDEDFRLKPLFENWQNWKLDVLINQLWNCRIVELFNVDSSSGGSDIWAGPLWVRPETLNRENIEGYDQVVGHTSYKNIRTVITPDLMMECNPIKRDMLVYADCLGSGDYYHLIRLKK